MPCYGPLTGYYSAVVSDTGKRRIVFDKRRSLTGIPMSVPCGQCVGCRLERSRVWAVRLMHEKRSHNRACFVTLTYDDDHLPLLQGPGIYRRETLVMRDAQLFMKRLRKKFGEGIKFYMCGEYGDETFRPHYHAILYSVAFDDMRRVGENKRGEGLFTSDQLSDLWPAGIHRVGEVTFDSCAYVARYVVKKITGDRADSHYAGRLPEFTNMSRRPGIGKSYFEKYRSEILTHDSVVINGMEVTPPRFYGDMFLNSYNVPEATEFLKLKATRKRKAIALAWDNSGGFFGRLRVKETIALKRLHMKKRSI